ncbi:MAG: glycosyltransferase family 39 protein [Magnetococcales bacterium]|nr:glycosyltransferase family 39 protein [Magnetococcales bacterium]
MFQKPFPDPDHPLFDRLSLLTFATVAILFMMTFRDYGYSWEELWHNVWYGKAILSHMGTFGADVRAVRYVDLHYYGGLYDSVIEAIAWLGPWEGFTVRRFGNGMMGLLGLVGTWRMGRMLAGPRGGFWALLLLVTMPAYYGHTFINAKDIPVAVGAIWSLYFLLRASVALPNPATRDLVFLGMSMGLAMGVRIGGIVLIAFCGMLLIVGLMMMPVAGRGFWRTVASLPWLRLLGLPIGIAGLLMIVFWPAVWHDPGVLREAFESARHHVWGRTVLLDGLYIRGDRLPWTYLPTYFAVTLPELFAMIVPVATLWGIHGIIDGWRRGDRLRTQGLLLLLVSIYFTPVYAVVNQTTLYDGIRHFLLIVPPMAVLGATALTALWRVPRHGSFWMSRTAAGLLGVYFLSHIVTMVRLHPYQYAYYNNFIGGLPGADKRFETEYWITSYREAAFKMVEHARREAVRKGLDFDAQKFTVGVAYVAINVTPFVPANFSVFETGKVENPDYIISTTRWNSDRQFDALPTVAHVARFGVVFAVVKGR